MVSKRSLNKSSNNNGPTGKSNPENRISDDLEYTRNSRWQQNPIQSNVGYSSNTLDQMNRSRKKLRRNTSVKDIQIELFIIEGEPVFMDMNPRDRLSRLASVGDRNFQQ